MRKIAKTCLILWALFVLSSCDSVRRKTKETINKGGETVGKTATEFFEGVGEGVEKTLAINIELSEDLKRKGLNTGKYIVSNGQSGQDNLLTVYIIFNDDLSDTLMVKAYDKSGMEIGRLKRAISGKKDDASYFEFEFDRWTNLESKGKVTIE